MDNGLKPGLWGEDSYKIEKKHLATSVGSGLVAVFSTAMMIGGMESAAVKAVQPFLAPGQTTVGVQVNVEHKAATPLGLKATFHAELLEISENGKGLLFRVEARDDKEIIGQGTHRRVIVDKERFEARTRAKACSPF